MREITLKELSAYLPYGLKVQTIYGEVETMELLGENDILTDGDEYSFVSIKPILRPISEIDTYIMHKGKKVNVLNTMCDYWECEWNGVTNEFELPFKNLTIEFSCNELPYMLVDILLEYHFDVFGLIDDNLAIPVTKDFNPYE
jgi:hypothetical protein